MLSRLKDHIRPEKSQVGTSSIKYANYSTLAQTSVSSIKTLYDFLK